MTSKRRIGTALSRAKVNSSTLLTSCIGPSAALVAAMTALIISSSTNSSSQAEKKEESERLDVYLMDRISKKSYLNYHSTVVSSSRNQQQQQQQPQQHFEQDHRYHSRHAEGGTKLSHTDNTRPKGVPSRLRILTVDVPEFKRDAFQHGVVCQLPSQIFDTTSNNTIKSSSSLAFVDGVAPSKPMNKTLGHNERTGTRDSRKPILQKSLAKQLYYCHYPHFDHPKAVVRSPQMDSEQQKKKSTARSNEAYPPVRIGAEILETSVLDLNPNNIRRFYTSSSKKYHYDPGKFTTKQQQDHASGIADADEAEIIETALDQNNYNPFDEEQLAVQAKQYEEKDIDDPDYERAAPWNQYAWLEEMHIRIHGLVPFGAPMKRAPIISQWLYGRIYHQSISISSSREGWLSWLCWPWSVSYAVGSPRYRTSWDGVDGEGESRLIGDDGGDSGRSKRSFPWPFSSRAVLNRASNKP